MIDVDEIETRKQLKGINEVLVEVLQCPAE